LRHPSQGSVDKVDTYKKRISRVYQPHVNVTNVTREGEGCKDRLKAKVERLKKFQQGVLGIKTNK